MSIRTWVIFAVVCNFSAPVLGQTQQTPAQVDQTSQRRQGGEEPSQPASDPQYAAVFKQIDDLVRQYFPKAKIVISPTKMHCEWKCKKEMGYYSGRAVLAPEAGGILCDLSLESGEYRGSDKDRLPCEVQDGFHSVLTMAPYSKGQGKHLLAQLSFPPDVSADFKDSFKLEVNKFNASELAEEAAAAKDAAAREAAKKAAAADDAKKAAASAKAAQIVVGSGHKPKLTGDISGGKVTVYVSTSDSESGLSVAEHHWWGEADNSSHVSCDLVPGVKNYLHVMVEPPNDRVVLAYFGLEYGATFEANGLTSLDTRPAYWRVSNQGWGINYHTPAVAPGGDHYLVQCPLLNKQYPNIQTIIDPQVGAGYDGRVYFSTTINTK